MIASSLTPAALVALRERWVARRDELHRLGALVDAARLCDELLADLAAAASDADLELLSLRQASAESGYSADHLGRLLRAGKLPNAGRTPRRSGAVTCRGKRAPCLSPRRPAAF